jgi:hypothetical protein
MVGILRDPTIPEAEDQVNVDHIARAVRIG